MKSSFTNLTNSTQQNFILQSKNLLEKALKLSEEYTGIPTNDKAIINHAWKSWNSCSTKAKLRWKDSRLFDVAISTFDRGEVSELFSNFSLHKLSEKYERKNLALCHDDGLTIFKNVDGPESEKIKKYLTLNL